MKRGPELQQRAEEIAEQAIALRHAANSENAVRTAQVAEKLGRSLIGALECVQPDESALACEVTLRIMDRVGASASLNHGRPDAPTPDTGDTE